MPRDFPELKDGDQLEPFHLNIIYRELRRWRKSVFVPPIIIDGLTSSDTPPVFRIGRGPQNYRGVVTTAIPTGTISTPSTTGVVTLYNWDGANSTAGETGVQVLNDFTLSASIAVGKVVRLQLIDGALWFVQAEC